MFETLISLLLTVACCGQHGVILRFFHDYQDREDSQREINPLKQAKDAILIDTTEMSKESQKSLALQIINQAIENGL